MPQQPVVDLEIAIRQCPRVMAVARVNRELNVARMNRFERVEHRARFRDIHRRVFVVMKGPHSELEQIAESFSRGVGNVARDTSSTNGNDRRDAIRMLRGESPGAEASHAGTGKVHPRGVDFCFRKDEIQRGGQSIVVPTLTGRTLRRYDDESGREFFRRESIRRRKIWALFDQARRTKRDECPKIFAAMARAVKKHQERPTRRGCPRVVSRNREQERVRSPPMILRRQNWMLHARFGANARRKGEHSDEKEPQRRDEPTAHDHELGSRDRDGATILNARPAIEWICADDTEGKT